jgi:quercetin dioxygenase-like cupin family protein
MVEIGLGRDEMLDIENAPWVDVADGIWFKLVKVLDNDSGWISMLRLRAGAAVGPHRHQGAVHGFVLQGTRTLMDGTICEKGSYVFEPPGNVDTWSATGEQDLISLFYVNGSVEYLSEDGQVTFRETAASKRQSWESAGAGTRSH